MAHLRAAMCDWGICPGCTRTSGTFGLIPRPYLVPGHLLCYNRGYQLTEVVSQVGRRFPGWYCRSTSQFGYAEGKGPMTIAQQSQIAASLLWLALILGPPLALALGAGMIYMDSATRGLNTVPVRADNRAILVLLLIALAVWV